MKLMIWSVLVAKRFRDVTMAPFGPSPYCDITSLYFTVSRISNLKIINNLSIFLETHPSHRGGTRLPPNYPRNYLRSLDMGRPVRLDQD